MEFCSVCYGIGQVLGAGMTKVKCVFCQVTVKEEQKSEEPQKLPPSPSVNVFKRRGRRPKATLSEIEPN
jgi:hypothetical protein